MRTCLGCRVVDRKSAMVRLAVIGGDVVPDRQSRLGGRGGYLHRRAECLDRFVKSKVREFRSLGCGVGRSARMQLADAIGRLASHGKGD